MSSDSRHEIAPDTHDGTDAAATGSEGNGAPVADGRRDARDQRPDDHTAVPRAEPADADDPPEFDSADTIGVPSISVRLHEALRREAAEIGGASQSADVRAFPAFAYLPGVDQKYVIESEIGRGGMSRVWATQDHDLGRVVAMKVLDDTLDVEPGEIGRFIQEGQITGQLEHPNIVPVHELGVTDDGQLFFTMKRVRGISLGEILFRIRHHDDRVTRQYGLRALVRVLLAVCDAIAYAHDRKVVHRDLKPENIMVGRFGEVLVMDWGIARVLETEPDFDADAAPTAASLADREITDRFEAPGAVKTSASSSGRLTVKGQVAGTPAYMPPEQAVGDVDDLGRPTLSRRVDVYALGAMLYEMLTLEPPYVGDSALVIVRQLMDNPPTPVRMRTPMRFVPAELAAITERAMARNPADRYPTVEALAADLQAWLDQRPVSVYRDSLLAMAFKWCRRHAAAAVALFSLILLMGLVTTFTLIALQQSREARRSERARLEAERERRVEIEQLLEREREYRAQEQKRARVEALLREAPRDPDGLDEAQLESALGLYNRVLALDPDHVGALVDRAVLLRRLGRRADAVRDVVHALEQAPEDVRANHQRALLAEEAHQYELALRHAERAVERWPWEFSLHATRLRILGELGRFDEAQQTIENLIDGLPELVRLRVWFCEVERLRAANPDDPPTLHLDETTPEGRALTLLNDRRYSRALAEFEAVCEARPQSVLGWYGRACCMARNNVRLAEIYLERAWENGLRDCPWHVLWYEPEFRPLHDLPAFRALAETGPQSRPARNGDDNGDGD